MSLLILLLLQCLDLRMFRYLSLKTRQKHRGRASVSAVWNRYSAQINSVQWLLMLHNSALSDKFRFYC